MINTYLHFVAVNHVVIFRNPEEVENHHFTAKVKKKQRNVYKITGPDYIDESEIQLGMNVLVHGLCTKKHMDEVNACFSPFSSFSAGAFEISCAEGLVVAKVSFPNVP